MTESTRTTEVPEGERFDFWRQLVSDTFVPLEASRDAEGPFHGELRGMPLGAVGLFQVQADRHVVRRTPRLITGSTGDYFKLGLQVEGHSLLVQDGRQAALGPGDFAVYDTTRPYTFAFGDASRLLVLIFPRPLLGLPCDRVAELTATRFAGQQGLGRLIGSFLTQASQVLDDMDVRDSTRLAGNVLDLLVTGLASHLATAPADVDSARRALFTQVVAHIEAHLSDPGLTPAGIAAAQHISTRYLHKLFHAQGTTVSAWIRGRRMEHCGHDLRSPAYAQRPVSAIAARWGLTDAAHFSRLFRATFGTSPRDYRADALER